jgi:hypothetical protein
VADGVLGAGTERPPRGLLCYYLYSWCIRFLSIAGSETSSGFAIVAAFMNVGKGIGLERRKVLDEGNK